MPVTSSVFVLIDGPLAAEAIVDIKIFIIAPLNQIYGITIKRVSAPESSRTSTCGFVRVIIYSAYSSFLFKVFIQ